MSKQLDLSKSVYELVTQYPELKDIMYDLGFKEITKKAMLLSMGKITTIPKGATMKKIPMLKVISTLEDNGFEIVDGSVSSSLKDYLKRLNDGDNLEDVRKDFVKEFKDVKAIEIMKAEQELIKEGTSKEEAQKLCDVHSSLFHGTTLDERINNTEKEIENQLLNEPINITGHPINILHNENKEISKRLLKCRVTKKLDDLKDISIHYSKKGDLIYPLLSTQYDISGPSDVMWGVDDAIRNELSYIIKNNKEKLVDELVTRIEEMIYKEENILFPICLENFSKEEWYQIYHDSKDYDKCFNVFSIWEEAENYEKPIETSMSDEIVMKGGHLTIEQLSAMLNTIPLEITFVDDKDINRYFNEGEKVFKRPSSALDREVYSCHPPRVEPMVRAIIEDFKGNVRNEMSVWMEKKGTPYLVKYMAVRDNNGKYLGTVEIVQDMSEAKKYFEDNKL